mgnify:CR=1 FL=1
MRPYQHAISSTATRQDWTHDLPIHEFLDSTKYACADRRHRVVLHHCDLGSDIAGRVFSNRNDVERVVQMHVREDLGRIATLKDWFDCCDLSSLPRPVTRRVEGGASGVAEHIAGRMPKETREAIDEVCSFLFLPLQYLPSNGLQALPILMNSAGPMIVRQVFGPPQEISDGIIVDYAWIAEAAIFTSFARIPDLGEIVRCWSSEPTKALCEAN